MTILFSPFDVIVPKNFILNWLSNLLTLSIHTVGYSRNASKTKILFSFRVLSFCFLLVLVCSHFILFSLVFFSFHGLQVSFLFVIFRFRFVIDGFSKYAYLSYYDNNILHREEYAYLNYYDNDILYRKEYAYLNYYDNDILHREEL